MFNRSSHDKKTPGSRSLWIGLFVSLPAIAQMACFLGIIHPAPPLDLRGTCPQVLAVGETIDFHLYVQANSAGEYTDDWESDIQPSSSGMVEATELASYNETYLDDYVTIYNVKLSFTALEPGPATLNWGTEPCQFMIVEADEPEGQTVDEQEPEAPSLADDGALEIDLPQAEPAQVFITADGLLVEPSSSLAIEEGHPIQLGVDSVNLSEPVFFSWMPSEGLDDPSIAMPLAGPEETTTYTVTATGSSGNSASQSVTLNIYPSNEETEVILRSFICESSSLTVRFDGIEPDEASTRVYAAHIGAHPFACLTWEGLPNSVLCSGSLSPQGMEASIELVAEDEGQVVYNAIHAVPMCTTPSSGSRSGSGGAEPEPTPFVCPPPEDCS